MHPPPQTAALDFSRDNMGYHWIVWVVNGTVWNHGWIGRAETFPQQGKLGVSSGGRGAP